MFISENENINLNNNNYCYDDRILCINAIPVVENSRIGAAVVSINDLNSIVEDYGCDYEDAFCAISEANHINPEKLAVVVEDWKLIESPELISIIPNIVVKPISESNFAYHFINECINEYCNTGDDQYLYNIINEDDTFVQQYIKNGAKIGAVLGTLGGAYLGRKVSHSIKANAGGAATGAVLGGFLGGGGGLKAAKMRADFNQKMHKINQNIALTTPVSGNVVKEAKKKNPSWISKKIAAIRHWIKTKLDRNKDPQKQGLIQKLKAKLLSIVNKLKEILHIKTKK